MEIPLKKLKYQSPNFVVLHCSATNDGADIDIKDIDKYHRTKKKWYCVGYHFFIKRDGTIQEGRPTHKQGAHVSGANRNSIGVCLAGTSYFKPVQLAAVYYLYEFIKEKHRITAKQWFCHNEFPSAKEQGKTCPNIRLEDVHPVFKAQV